MFRGLKGRRVVVSTLDSDVSFRGVVARAGLLHLELAPAATPVQVLNADGTLHDLDGTLRIPRSRIAGIQVL